MQPPVQGGKYCPRCGHRNPEFAEFCSRCGQNLAADDWSSAPPQGPPVTPPYGPAPGGNYSEYAPFHMPVIDPYGGIPREEKIEDVTAEDLALFTGNNAAYYLPKFYKMSKSGTRCIWNWPAFLITPYWLLFRKNYLAGILVLLLNIAKNFVNTYVMLACILPAIGVGTSATYAELYAGLLQGMADGKIRLYIWILFLTVIADLLIRLLFGLLGNYIYMRTAVARIKKLEASRPDAYKQALSSTGGTSILMVFISYMLMQFSGMLLQMLLVT